MIGQKEEKEAGKGDFLKRGRGNSGGEENKLLCMSFCVLCLLFLIQNLTPGGTEEGTENGARNRQGCLQFAEYFRQFFSSKKGN